MTPEEKQARIKVLRAQFKASAKEYFDLVAPTSDELDIIKDHINCDDDWSDTVTDEKDAIGQYFLADFVESYREMNEDAGGQNESQA